MKTIAELIQSICLYGFGIPTSTYTNSSEFGYVESMYVGEIKIYSRTVKY